MPSPKNQSGGTLHARKILKIAGFVLLSLALAAIAIGCFVAPTALGFTVWRREALVIALALIVYSTPAVLIAGLPLAYALPKMLWPFIGLVIGAAYWMFLSWLDDYFTGPGVSAPWTLVGGAYGLAVGIFAGVIAWWLPLDDQPNGRAPR
jgi:hypothetical protein